jgi:hypothetical protein
MSETLFYIVVILVLLVFFLKRLFVVGEHERMAINALGRFTGFKGPGLLFKISGVEQWHRVAVGDRGEVLAAGVVRINGTDLPVEDQSVAVPGELVRVVGFTQSAVQVRRDDVQTRTFTCEKCGHQNVLSE